MKIPMNKPHLIRVKKVFIYVCFDNINNKKNNLLMFYAFK